MRAHNFADIPASLLSESPDEDAPEVDGAQNSGPRDDEKRVAKNLSGS